ncbi:TIGR04283 family arsenosugar biosynthesis glycosyltransferase [Methylibium sp.]|uniref:TIGR04283 family arsenosugar biosynthesis glycosyltransferase n=1 Tax=Methylibium sp. TaxID=2067992 RepID=UPI003D104F5D
MILRLSIVVPALDEAGLIAATLAALAPLRALGHEVIVVDGGSRDGTLALCQGRADAAFIAPRGRARQMNAGAARARGDVLLFLHADTLLPVHADVLVAEALQGGASWGRFDVRITGRSLMLPVIAALMNRRSCWTGIATGDQAMFVRRSVFECLGGFADLSLMEDVDLSRRLRAQGAPACLRERVVTSGRRWEAHGVWRTTWLMWRLRWCHWRGVPADELAKAYR